MDQISQLRSLLSTPPSTNPNITQIPKCRPANPLPSPKPTILPQIQPHATTCCNNYKPSSNMAQIIPDPSRRPLVPTQHTTHDSPALTDLEGAWAEPPSMAIEAQLDRKPGIATLKCVLVATHNEPNAHHIHAPVSLTPHIPQAPGWGALHCNTGSICYTTCWCENRRGRV